MVKIKSYVVHYHNDHPEMGYAGFEVFGTYSEAERYLFSELETLKTNGWRIHDELDLHDEHGKYRRITLVDDNPEETDSYNNYEIAITAKFIEYYRQCTNCDSPMNEGFCVEDGLEYYCSTDCIKFHYNDEEYNELIEKDYAYWTHWEE